MRPRISGNRGRLSCPTALITHLDRLRRPVPRPHGHRPGSALFVEQRALNVRVETDVFPDAVLVGAVIEVVEQHLPVRVPVRPVMQLERVRVDVVLVVDAAARVLVLPPRSPDLRVLLDDRVRDPLLIESDRRQQSRHPRADDQHPEARACLRRNAFERGVRVGVLPLDPQLSVQELLVLPRNALADQVVRHLLDHRVRRSRR